MNSLLSLRQFNDVWSKEIESVLDQSGNCQKRLKINVNRPKPNPYYIPDRELKQRTNQHQDIIRFSQPLMNHYIPKLDQNIYLTLIDEDGCVLFSLDDNQIGAMCPGFMIINQNHTIKNSLVKGTIVELYSNKTNENYICLPIGTDDPTLFLAIANIKGKIPGDYLKLAHSLYKVLLTQFLMSRYFLEVSNSLLELNQDYAIIADEDGFITDANTSCLNLFGLHSKETLQEIHMKELFNDFPGIMGFNRLHDNNSFKVYSKSKWRPIELINKKIINYPSGKRQFVFSFRDQIKSSISQITKRENNIIKLISFEDIIATSPKINKSIDLARKVAPLSTTVLIEGESGTGKDLIAQGIHTASGRKGPFVAINCGSIPRELLESELFGYSDGTFTGAKKGGKTGKIVEANGGTLFLDEIGEMPKDMQVALLRFIQNKEVIPLGSKHPHKVDVRIISATNRNLRHEVDEGSFREDLYYRLNVVNIRMPALRERKEDIPLLAEHTLSKLCQEFGMPLKMLSTQGLNKLVQYDWPGNVRELQNVLEAAIVNSEQHLIFAEDLDIEERINKPKSINDEKEELLDLMNRYGGNISAVAKELGIARTTLYRKLKKWNVDRN